MIYIFQKQFVIDVLWLELHSQSVKRSLKFSFLDYNNAMITSVNYVGFIFSDLSCASEVVHLDSESFSIIKQGSYLQQVFGRLWVQHMLSNNMEGKEERNGKTRGIWNSVLREVRVLKHHVTSYFLHKDQIKVSQHRLNIFSHLRNAILEILLACEILPLKQRRSRNETVKVQRERQ